jgi:hypothetical protein
MHIPRNRTCWILLLMGSLIAPMFAIGCQSTTGGQTYPSNRYLQDDVQHYPHGPEQKLNKQVEAIEAYKRQQQQVENVEGQQQEP